ncbi:hypothetical protein ACIB24_16875 [Spongisporangium articulatum]|uniref:Uncharacterized protein n=1 Tax=Spongisporangium articulatum TaxID=3362603 RepID=A0ABW8AQT6_9ACTN
MKRFALSRTACLLTVAALTAASAVVAAPAQAAAVCAADGSCLQSATLDRGTVDLTANAYVPVKVSVRVTSPRTLISVSAGLSVTSATQGTIELSAALVRVSGTAQDGVWEGTFRLRPGVIGTWRLTDVGGADGVTDGWHVTPGALAPGVQSVVTAAPAKPTGLRATTVWSPLSGVNAVFTWKGIPATAVAALYQLQLGGVCSGTSSAAPGSPEQPNSLNALRRAPLPGPCTGKLRAVNDRGASEWTAQAMAVI